jgi:hypothetical protein
MPATLKNTQEDYAKAMARIVKSNQAIEAKFPNDGFRQLREIRRLCHVRQANFRRPLLRKMQQAIDSGDTEAAIDAAVSACFLCDSEGRLRVMIHTLVFNADVPPEVFWPVWMLHWSSVDYSAHWHKYLPGFFRQRGPAAPFYTEEQENFFAGLPDKVTVYRGCDASLVHGVSWTTRKNVARYFATGGRYGVPDNPVVLTGEIARESPDLFYVTGDDRSEAEIVCTPKIIATEPQTAEMIEAFRAERAKAGMTKGEG